MYMPADDFDYLKLMALGRAGPALRNAPRALALLGYCTTSYYAKVLRGIGKAAGFPIATFESEYDTAEQTLLDERSKLYDFEPQMIIFVTAVQALRDRLLAVDLAQRSEAAEAAAQALVSQINRAARFPGVTVIVHELVIPYERAWGNLTTASAAAYGKVVAQINDRLRVGAGNAKRLHAELRSHRFLAWQRNSGLTSGCGFTAKVFAIPKRCRRLPARPGHHPGTQGKVDQMHGAGPGQHALGRRDWRRRASGYSPGRPRRRRGLCSFSALAEGIGRTRHFAGRL